MVPGIFVFFHHRDAISNHRIDADAQNLNTISK